ncbi:hypothetical protein [Brevibacterium oceani]|uniref:hypothetical protein n=1 Tax=Brevibacterium oceani TaxID=358099 RepID=UPI0015E68CA9|nr:hypothetical protein [Brevibacterium oceani]
MTGGIVYSRDHSVDERSSLGIEILFRWSEIRLRSRVLTSTSASVSSTIVVCTISASVVDSSPFSTSRSPSARTVIGAVNCHYD